MFLGKASDNTADAWRKRRFAFGVRHPGSKLSVADVRDIRSRYRKGEVYQHELAKEHGVSQARISIIVRGEGWRHLD